MYLNLKDGERIIVVDKLAALTGVNDEERESLRTMEVPELQEKLDEYLGEFVDVLNGIVSDKENIQNEINSIKTEKLYNIH